MLIFPVRVEFSFLPSPYLQVLKTYLFASAQSPREHTTPPQVTMMWKTKPYTQYLSPGIVFYVTSLSCL